MSTQTVGTARDGSARASAGCDRARIVAGARAKLGPLALGAFVMAATYLAVAAARGDYLVEISGGAPAWVDGPLHALAVDIGGLGATGLSWLLIAMALTYVMVLAHAPRLPARTVWAAIVIVNVLFALTPTLVSSDVFGYLAYARDGVLHGLDPYLRPPAAAPHDAIYALVYWRHATSPYGPLFTLTSYPLALLSPVAALWTLKATTGAASIGLAWCTARAAAARGLDERRAAALVGLNPVLLFYAVSGAHNDILALLLVTGAVALATRRRESRAAVVLVAGAAVKLTAGLALPFLLIGARARTRAWCAAAGASTTLAAVSLAVFGPHLLDQLRRISSDTHFDIAFSGPDRLGLLLGTGITPTVRAVSVGLAAVIILILLVRTAHGADWITAAGWATLALMATVASFAPWYLVWLLPLAAISSSRALRVAALAVTAYILVAHLPLLGGVPWLSPSHV